MPRFIHDPLTRFSNRVENYVRYRPSYPPELFKILTRELGFTSSHVVADVGSGTGIFSALLLERGHTVYGIEPNAEMRQAAERLLAPYEKFHSLNGNAEATTLPPRSVDCVTAAQAFHWFRPQAARTEFMRILKPGGHVILVWNVRRTDTSPFLRAYEELLLRYGTDYAQVQHGNASHAEGAPSDLETFFGAASFKKFSCENAQVFDFEALKGRLLSSSYAPTAEHPQHTPMLDALENIFAQHQRDGRVTFEYDTEIYCGMLSS